MQRMSCYGWLGGVGGVCVQWLHPPVLGAASRAVLFSHKELYGSSFQCPVHTLQIM